MKAIAQSIAWIGLYLGILYGLTYFALSPLYPPFSDTIDTSDISSFYLGPYQQIIMNQQVFDNPDKKIIFLGSSNVREGFRPPAFSPSLREKYRLINLGLGSSNFKQIRQLIQLVSYASRHQPRQSTTFVLGTWYGLFVSDEVRWPSGATNLENEMLRFALYEKKSDLERTIKNNQLFYAYLFLLKPYVLFSNWVFPYTDDFESTSLYLSYRKIIKEGKRRMGLPYEEEDNKPLDDELLSEGGATESKGKKIGEKGGKQKKVDLVEVQKRRTALSMWHKFMGSRVIDYPKQQLDYLEHICEHITSIGSRLLIVDMPLPSWHKEGSPHYQAYQSFMSGLVAKIIAKYPRVHLMSLGDLENPEDFYDSVHPTKPIAAKWTATMEGKL